jgi:HSP20 family protein
MHDFHSPLLSSELRDLADELRQIFDELDRAAASDRRAPLGASVPPLDVLETDTAVEIVLDVSGVVASGVRVLIKGGVVLVAGVKAPADAAERADASFHLVERSFGRFARAVRLTGAFNASEARASLKDGQLSVMVPKIADRRGREIMVPVTD